MREFQKEQFDKAFTVMATSMQWHEEPRYYPRYYERYLAVLREFALSAREESLDILEIGGGQLAYLSSKLWDQDNACVADINEVCFRGLNDNGIDTFIWNLAADDPPVSRQFDAIFFSEVIEHLPVPGHVALARLRALLRPGGILLCSTPNLYRLRNIFYMITGRQLFDHFGLPGIRGYGHVLEYSAEHLAWQFREAGFEDFTIELKNFTHTPNRPLDRALAALGTPLRRIPRYRDNLLAVAHV